MEGEKTDCDGIQNEKGLGHQEYGAEPEQDHSQVSDDDGWHGNAISHGGNREEAYLF